MWNPVYYDKHHNLIYDKRDFPKPYKEVLWKYCKCEYDREIYWDKVHYAVGSVYLDKKEENARIWINPTNYHDQYLNKDWSIHIIGWQYINPL